MSHRTRLTLAGCAALTLVSLFLWPRRTIPTYQGLTVHDWFNRYSGRRLGNWDKPMGPPSLAFKAMGTNALPFLAARINQPQGYSRIDLLRAKYHQQIPRFLTPLLPRQPGEKYREGLDAAKLVLEIQPPGNLLVPLIAPALQSSNAIQRRIGLTALVGGSSDFEAARPYLAQGLQDRDKEVQRVSCSAIQRQGQEGAWAVTNLVNAASTFDNETLKLALQVLDGFGTNALPIVPSLESILEKETDGSRRRVLEIAIEDISLWSL